MTGVVITAKGESEGTGGWEGGQLEEFTPKELAIGTGHLGGGTGKEGAVQVEVTTETPPRWQVPCFVHPQAQRQLQPLAVVLLRWGTLVGVKGTRGIWGCG